MNVGESRGFTSDSGGNAGTEPERKQGLPSEGLPMNDEGKHPCQHCRGKNGPKSGHRRARNGGQLTIGQSDQSHALCGMHSRPILAYAATWRRLGNGLGGVPMP